jgi:tripartite-type tricarboxylate transporter receptor subunit TctC
METFMRNPPRWISALFAGVLGLFVTAANPALAETWPKRPVRVIVPNPAGVNLDVIARLFAERLGNRWGHRAIIENMPGADGNIAAREFVSRNDDHTLLYSFAGLITVNPLVYDKLPYDPEHDLVPIAATSNNLLAIAVSSTLPAASLADLANLARSRPDGLTWAATPGLPYFAFAAFQKLSGIDMQEVRYRDFNPAIVDAGESRIDILVAGFAPLLPHTQAGKIKLIAFINGERASIAPEVPTIAEAGYPQLTLEAVTGFFGNRTMAATLRERIAADVKQIADDPVLGAKLAAMGSIAQGSTPAEFAAAIAVQRDRVAAIARSLKSNP